MEIDTYGWNWKHRSHHTSGLLGTNLSLSTRAKQKHAEDVAKADTRLLRAVTTCVLTAMVKGIRPASAQTPSSAGAVVRKGTPQETALRHILQESVEESGPNNSPRHPTTTTVIAVIVYGTTEPPLATCPP